MCAVERWSMAEMDKLRTQLETLHKVEEESRRFSGQVSALEQELGLTRHELERNRKVGGTLGRICMFTLLYNTPSC